MRLTTASLAILGSATIAVSALASPAMAHGTMARHAKYTQAQTAEPGVVARGERRAMIRSERIRNANAALPRERVYRRPVGPAEAAGNVVGGAVATAGAIATAPFRAFDSGYYDNSYNNYYGYGYGGRDWKTYASRNNLACTPGATFKGPDGRQHPCQ